MSKVSIIISARNEKYLKRTVEDIYEKATGEFEVIIGLNGKTEFEVPRNFPNLKVIESGQNIGLKQMINLLVSNATGKYIYKSDAHCMFGKGFDEILQENMEDNWVVTPRFYVLNAEKWEVQDERFYDYFYLCCPFTDKRGLRFKAGGHWPERTAERINSHPFMDETPQIHGSSWFVNREYFLNTLKGFPLDDPFGHAQEPIWLGLKNWLKGGKVMVNKRTWYAHLHQDGDKRGYKEDKAHTERTYNEVANYWLNNKEPNLMHDFEWFVNKFKDMPTWPSNWYILYSNYLHE